jgi:hypothetical protein
VEKTLKIGKENPRLHSFINHQGKTLESGPYIYYKENYEQDLVTSLIEFSDINVKDLEINKEEINDILN